MSDEEMISMNGEWRGRYHYDEEALEVQHGNVPFRMMLQEGANGALSGSVEDSELGGGTPGVGTIEGKRRGRELRWLKRMPVLSVIEEDASGDLVMKNDASQPHNTLVYRGTLSPDGRRATGEWRFKGLLQRFFGTKGTWSLDRIDG